jgi:hypothetical protein
MFHRPEEIPVAGYRIPCWNRTLRGTMVRSKPKCSTRPRVDTHKPPRDLGLITPIIRTSRGGRRELVKIASNL